MISGRMHLPARVPSMLLAALAVAVLGAGCGTERIDIPKSDPNYASDLAGATLFSQRCAGCHTFSYAATHGSAANIRTAQAINGPDFDQRCERPVDRVLYAIENGGFSGAYMPANVVVGKQAREVAMFVARFSGTQQPKIPGQPTCRQESVGTLPAPVTASTPPVATTASVTTTSNAGS
jgi:cytochrome c551